MDWSVGYFRKTRIQDEELREQTVEEDVKTIEDLKDKVSKDVERKLREASTDQSHELEQQKAQVRILLFRFRFNASPVVLRASSHIADAQSLNFDNFEPTEPSCYTLKSRMSLI